jgi:hypothetical protein
MTQRKTSRTTVTESRASKSPVRHDLDRQPPPSHDQYLTRFQETVLRNSTPGPVQYRADYDPRQAPDQMHERRNRLRSWSYKGAGIQR